MFGWDPNSRCQDALLRPERAFGASTSDKHSMRYSGKQEGASHLNKNAFIAR